MHLSRAASAGAALLWHLNDGPVAPPAPDVPVSSSGGAQHWEHLALPKSHRLDQVLSPELHPQT